MEDYADFRPEAFIGSGSLPGVPGISFTANKEGTNEPKIKR
jgi:hypothetical protein